MDSQWAPCRYNCPVHADVRLYLEHIARGQWRQAIDVIRENLPLAAVCGRICHHPCEANCRRKDVDDSVAIREVKRYVAELQGAGGATVHKALRQDKAAVAVVGAGPAGLAAALDLAKLGYRPTLLEKFSVAGGIPATAIPRYRMPPEILQIDVDWVLAHGVELRTGVEIGKDKTVAALMNDGFAAVVIATGLARSRTLPLPGSDHRRVYPVLEFLQAINFGRPPEIGRDVLIIGGGNVAVDAARSAVRLGAARVRMMCLEDAKEMPAWSWEQHEAQDEGVTFIHRRGPVAIRTANGQITSLLARKVTRVFDANRRFDPQYDDADAIEVECDTVVLAIGQMADLGFASGSELKSDARGRLICNAATHETSMAGVFACGEIITPPGSVVEACASGRRAAKAVDMYLRGQPVAIDDTLPPAIDVITAATADKVRKVTRQSVAFEPAESRRCGFGAVDHNYSAQAAVQEARRCMGCGGGAQVLADKCAACLTCLRVCPFDIPKVADVAVIESTLCQACGICIAECPNNAIVARSWQQRDIVGRTAEAIRGLGSTGRNVVAYLCGQNAPAAAWRGELNDTVPGVAELMLPSLARLGVRDILAAFEHGADAVVIVADRDAAERYPQATLRMKKRFEQAAALLAEVGYDRSCLRWAELPGDDRAAIRAVLAEAAAGNG